MNTVKTYEAIIICTVFDEKYSFEDNILIGVAHSPTEARSLLMDDILRVMEDFGGSKCEVESGRSGYDNPLTIVHTHDGDGVMHWHYYCLFSKTDAKVESEDKE